MVCFTHSLASDGGMWAEQVPPLLAAGYRAPGAPLGRHCRRFRHACSALPRFGPVIAFWEQQHTLAPCVGDERS